jgi:ketosteroid isomerase-like protein
MGATMSKNVTPERVTKAYEALASGDAQEIEKYWDEDMVWLVPGHNQLSGWKHGRGEFLAFMGHVGELSGGSFHMQAITVLTNDDYSCDVTNNQGTRAHDPTRKLNIDVAHVLRWRDGKVIAGKGGIFADGTAQYDAFWA